MTISIDRCIKQNKEVKQRHTSKQKEVCAYFTFIFMFESTNEKEFSTSGHFKNLRITSKNLPFTRLWLIT